ncbi:uncharacterized protein HD556DRAFT_1438751 [Suillus plorans]|uniref:ATP-dependent DNA helicase n=1 Tax=Suillus plorans TaxID=116603 RepID=A0A9P7DQR3_9AGAM|nr:uncharacterized protein HD556DRAFT_1438751 [Suillus plorans]KAG1800749.1 hypothetical protein HD556DRAFT_1438751 [Suillus plorans]
MYEMLSLLSRAVACIPMNQPSETPYTQIHAQQAARYVRGLGDGIPSHETMPMLSSLLMSYVKDLMQTSGGCDESMSDAGKDNSEEPLKSEEYKDDRLSNPPKSITTFISKAKSKDVKNMHETHLGVLQRHALMGDHPLWQTHKLLEHTNEVHGDGSRELIPCIVGMAIPRRTHPNQWQLFMLAHFKPFSHTSPLIPKDSSIEEVFETYTFTPRSHAIMQHWEAVHECEDEQDTNCLQRQAQLTTPKKGIGNLPLQLDNKDEVLPGPALGRTAQEEFKHAQTPATETPSTPTETFSLAEVINMIGIEFQLNDAQWVAFCIIADHFVGAFVEKHAEPCHQLTMLMTEPGGTGKMHVVKAVRAVMEYYGYGHVIQFLALTSSVASLIDGMTIHKGLGIKIRAKSKGKGNRALGKSMEDYSVIVSNQSKTQLHDKWKNMAFLLVDEASLLGLQLLAQLDHALRVVKEQPDLWFGGITLILSGNFFSTRLLEEAHCTCPFCGMLDRQTTRYKSDWVISLGRP